MALLAAAALCLVVGVVDGDTLRVRCEDHDHATQIRVRVNAIDAPEPHQPFGEQARQALAALCDHQPVELVTVPSSRWQRTTAEVKCAGKDAASEMVRGGWAWVYEEYARDYPRLYPLQSQAQVKHLGLWAGPAPIAPWVWRHGH